MINTLSATTCAMVGSFNATMPMKALSTNKKLLVVLLATSSGTSISSTLGVCARRSE